MITQYSTGAGPSSSSSATTSAFAAYVNSLPPTPEGTIRMFSAGNAYWTVVGENAVFIATEYYKTEAVLKDNAGGFKTVDLSRRMFEDTVRDVLQVRKLKIEVHEGPGGRWACTGTASPGNLKMFEDLVARSDGDNSCTVVVRVTTGPGGVQVLAIASADAAGRVLRAAEMPENDQYTNFEAVLVQLGATEVVLPTSTSATVVKRLSGIAQAAGVLVTRKPSSFFSPSSVEQDVRRLTGAGADDVLPGLDAEGPARCLAAVIKYLELLDNPATYGKFKLRPLSLSEYMRLDAAAVSALHLFEAGPGTLAGSVFALLNHCRTPQGARKLNQWLKQPLLSIEKINRRLDLVELFTAAHAVRAALHGEALRAVPDLFRLASKFLKSKATLEDMVRLYQAAAKLPAIIATLSSWSGDGADLLAAAFIGPLTDLAADLAPFCQLVTVTIDLDRADDHEYVIRHTFNDKLVELEGVRVNLVAQIDAIHSDVNAELSRKAKAKTSGKTTLVKLDSNDQHGYYLRIARKHDGLLRAQSAYTSLETRKDGVKFTTAPLRALSSQYMAVVAEYKAEQTEAEAKVLQIGSSYTTVFEDLNDVIASLDVVVALAEAALSAPIPYVRPRLVEHGAAGLQLTNARHPCLEAMHDVQCIPNDIELGPPGSPRTLLVTGPNMGGKSTYIRTAGLCVLLAQVGSFVPASAATIPVADCILARVGAGDSQLRGVSTFMAEMLETAAILATATPASLIIIDELGRGTSTYDGYGLAYAIAEHISTSIGALCVFATHFHELTALAADHPTAVANVHVTAHTADDALTLLYKVKPGACDRSFGIHVARLARFPPPVINMAKRKAEALEDFDSFVAAGNDAKRAKNLDGDVISAGEALIKHALDDARGAIATAGGSPDDASNWSPAHTAAVAPVLDALRAAGNPYVDALLAKFAPA